MTVSVALSHRFPGFTLEVAFEAPPGVTVLFGRSGSGKSTVINAVAGLLRPDRGRVVIGAEVLFDTTTARSVPPHRRRLGYVFQDARLFPHLTVRQNLTYGQWFAPPGAGPTLAQVVEMLGIGALLARRPGALSGGERSRVALGRALLSRPRALLMDEPLAALDEARKAEILPYLERLRDVTQVPILYVSHAMPEVVRLATTLVVLEAGRVVAAGPAGVVLSSLEAAPHLAGSEAGAVLPARLVAQEGDGLSRLQTSAGPLFLPRIEGSPGLDLRLRIAAGDVILSRSRPEGLSALNILPGTVRALQLEDGPGALVQLQVGSDLLLARLTRRSVAALDLAPGVAVHAILKSVALARENPGG